METELHKKFIRGLKLLDLSEEDIQNYIYVGSDQSDSSGYKFFLQHFPHGIMPEHESYCVCGHYIEKNYYLYNKIEDKFLVIGSECINQFTEGKIRHCNICKKVHNRHKDNICNNCNELNITFLSKSKKIIDRCISKKIINQNEEDIWNSYPIFKRNNELQIYNYEQLNSILNIYKKYFEDLCPIDCEYRTNILNKYTIKYIINNLSIRNNNIIETYLHAQFDRYKQYNLIINKYQSTGNVYTLIPYDISQHCFKREIRLENKFIQFTYIKTDTYCCKNCKNEFYNDRIPRDMDTVKQNLDKCFTKQICWKCYCKKKNKTIPSNFNKKVKKIKKIIEHVNCIICSESTKFDLMKQFPLEDFICDKCDLL